MKNDKIEISQYGSLLLYKQDYTPEFVHKVIKLNKLSGLRIWTDPMEDPPTNLDFLRDFTFLEALDVTSVYDYQFGFLTNLSGLRKLSIHIEGKNEIDLGHQTNLEYLAIQWRKGKIKGIEKCQQLNSLCLIGFKEDDFSSISYLRKLVRLMVKTASIKTLDGLENFQFLESILLGNCRSLQFVRSINGLENTKSLEIESCTKIKDYESLTDLPSLEYLRLTNCKGVGSIEFIENFRSLKKLVLNGNTDILDGNMTPAKRVQESLYPSRKHYYYD